MRIISVNPFPLISLWSIFLGVLFFLAAGGGAEAATISAPGMDVNDPSWRTPGVAKALDVDGDNIYGSAGYLLVRFNSAANSTAFSTVDGTNGTLNTLPTYLTVTSVAGTGPDRMFGAKAAIDDPNNVGGADVATGVAYRNTGFNDNNAEPYLTLTIGSGVPASGLRLGVLTDNSAANDPPTSITLTQSVGSGSNTQSYLSAYAGVQQPDWYFFDILGANAGDAFVLSFGNRALGSKPTVAGLTLDVVPEPRLAPLCAVGLIAVLHRPRRQGSATRRSRTTNIARAC